MKTDEQKINVLIPLSKNKSQPDHPGGFEPLPEGSFEPLPEGSFIPTENKLEPLSENSLFDPSN